MNKQKFSDNKYKKIREGYGNIRCHAKPLCIRKDQHYHPKRILNNYKSQSELVSKLNNYPRLKF